MKIGTKLCCVLLVFIVSGFQHVNAEEDEDKAEPEDTFTIDPNTLKNETYDGVVGNYGQYNFFADENIEDKASLAKEEKKEFEETQNQIFLKEKEKEKSYKQEQNSIFEEPYKGTTKEAKEEPSYTLTFGLMLVVVCLGFVYFMYGFYNKRVKERVNAYDNNHSFFEE